MTHQEALDMAARHTRLRDEAAQRAREIRATLRNAKSWELFGIQRIEVINRTARSCMKDRGCNPPFKPTISEIVKRARQARWNSRSYTRRMGEWDTEYYSACGHDDYLGDCAHEAYEWSVELMDWAKALKRGR